MNSSATLSTPATFATGADPNGRPSALPTLPSQIAFRVAQMGRCRAAIRREAHIELGFDDTTGRYHVAVSEQTARF